MISSELIVLFSTISTALVGLCGLSIRYAYLSKCNKVQCCCCSYERDIAHEINTGMIDVDKNKKLENQPSNISL